MEIKFYGANCIRFTTKNRSFTIDDNLIELGGKSPVKDGDALFYTQKALIPKKQKGEHFVASGPGEYELGSIMAQGYSARSHMDEDGAQTATIYKFVIERTSLVVLGHVHPDLSEEVFESIGMVDVLCIPVGGHGYTLDPQGAVRLARKIAPKVIIPTHYDDKELKFEVPQSSLEDFIAELKQEVENEDSLKLKAGAVIETTATRTVVLSRG